MARKTSDPAVNFDRMLPNAPFHMSETRKVKMIR